jgi:hypothetical protein
MLKSTFLCWGVSIAKQSGATLHGLPEQGMTALMHETFAFEAIDFLTDNEWVLQHSACHKN